MLDAHCHFWALERGDYGWLLNDAPELTKIRRDFLPEDYPAKGAVIAVQAAPSDAETDFLLNLAEKHSQILGVIGWADLDDPSCGARLSELAEHPKFLGLRPMLQDIPQTDWLLNIPCKRAIETLIENDLCFDALITTRHLPMLYKFAAEHADLSIIIDHSAKPQPHGRGDWLIGLKTLAQRPNCFCKLSGLMTEFDKEQLADPLPPLREIFARILEHFGPERVIWGSDWPVLTLATSYSEWQALTTELLSGLGKDERLAIMGGNAARIYGVQQ